MTFGSFFNSIGHALNSTAAHKIEGAVVAGVEAYSPGLGALVEFIANAIFSVEAKYGSSIPGADKKAQVQQIIDISAPITLALLSTITGKTMADPTAIAPAINKLIDDLVFLFNASGIFIKVAPPVGSPAPAGPPAIPTAG